MTARERRYRSFLLRLWQVKHNNEESWHASLEDPHTGERHGFANIETLMKFLLQQTQSGEEEKEKHPNT
jgi:hypothetical protein